MADILIAGAGIAGTTSAILLGRAGLKVALFERERTPENALCGGAVMPAGVHMLLRHQLTQQQGQVFYGLRYYQHKQLIAQGRFPSYLGEPSIGISYSRIQLEQELRQRAQETPNVELHTESFVERPIWHSHQVCGLICNQKAHYAPLSIIADGINSPLRRMLGLSQPSKHQRYTFHCHYQISSEQELDPWLSIYLGHNYRLYSTPLPDHRVAITAVTSQQPNQPLDELMPIWLQQHPQLAQQLHGAEQVTRLERGPPFTQQARQGIFPGGLLLGDAAGAIDPITGGGISQALLSSELLASILWHKQQLHHQHWLALFERKRHHLLHDHQVLTQSLVFLHQYPQALQYTLRLLHNSPWLFSHIMGVLSNLRHLNGLQLQPPSVPATKPPH